ncbi:NUDIX domain-containing protein [Mycolicibacter terrae]|uniref:NUDIX domain-containing protein n=1 Tax=Mycolicibacter terrae TaxID=1788 RepID=A0ACD2EI61_9MYCO|nr:NUDIX domain-containing protein [Mycolicibacter terrae]RRR40756.1 NUDIX domain-containing protein [Mycolicibacter terrae]
MAKRSAGLLLYRSGADDAVEVLIVHPGGPFWARKDDGAWSIPKGEQPDGEDPWLTARREFVEEIGLDPPDGERLDLGVVRQAGGKLVTVFAVHGDLDVTDARSNTFELEWPPRSGKRQEFPEVDRVGWVALEQARIKLLAGQRPVLDRLAEYLKTRP